MVESIGQKGITEKLSKLQQESMKVLTESSLNLKNFYIAGIMNILHQLKNEINDSFYARLLNNAIDDLANPNTKNHSVLESLSELTGDMNIDKDSALNY